jgi:hypothetical protein
MTSVSSLKGNLPEARLAAPGQASQQLSQVLSHIDQRAALRHLASVIQGLFGAECVAVFLAEDAPGTLVLEAAVGLRADAAAEGVPAGGLLAQVARQGTPIRLHGAALAIYPTGWPVGHLASGSWRSTLILP